MLEILIKVTTCKYHPQIKNLNKEYVTVRWGTAMKLKEKNMLPYENPNTFSVIGNLREIKCNVIG